MTAKIREAGEEGFTREIQRWLDDKTAEDRKLFRVGENQSYKNYSIDIATVNGNNRLRYISIYIHIAKN